MKRSFILNCVVLELPTHRERTVFAPQTQQWDLLMWILKPKSRQHICLTGSSELNMICSKRAPVVPSVLGIFVSEWLFFFHKTGNSDTTKSNHPQDASWIWFELQTFYRWDQRGASFFRCWQTTQHKDKRTKGLLLMERTYLPHVPIAVFLRYPVGYIGSTAYPDCPVVGVNPSFAWRGRKAEAERQDAQQAPSPSGVADHLLPLLTRLFSSSSSSSSADRQTTKLLFSPSKTFIETQLSGQRHRERRQGKYVPYPKTSACHMGELQVCVPSALSLIPLLSFFLHGGGGGSLSEWTCPCAVRLCARVCGRPCARRASRGWSLFSADNSDVAPLSSSGIHVAKWLQRLPTNN